MEKHIKNIQFNFRWKNETQKKEFLDGMKKMGASTLAEYFRRLHYDFKQKSNNKNNVL